MHWFIFMALFISEQLNISELEIVSEWCVSVKVSVKKCRKIPLVMVMILPWLHLILLGNICSNINKQSYSKSLAQKSQNTADKSQIILWI